MTTGEAMGGPGGASDANTPVLSRHRNLGRTLARAAERGHGTRTDDVSPLFDNGLRDPADAVGTETGTVGDDSGPIDPDLRVVIDAWPTLPGVTRRQILALANGRPPIETPG